MDIGETLCVTSRGEWRRWLAGHHRDKKEIWLVFHKKASGGPSVSNDDAVEEAICHGWIDSQTRSIDESRYATRFTPRREKSHWSESNKTRALEMLHQGKMTPAGTTALPPEVLEMWHSEVRPPNHGSRSKNPSGEAQRLVGQAKASLAERLGVSPDEIVVRSVEAVEFPDTSLGVPQPNRMYAQVITPGYVIILIVDNMAYEYHGSGDYIVTAPNE